MINRPRLFVSIPDRFGKRNPLTPLSDPGFDNLSPLDQLKTSWAGVTIQETMDGIVIYTDSLVIPKIIYSAEAKSRVTKNGNVYSVYIRSGFTGRLRVITNKCHIVLFEDIITEGHFGLQVVYAHKKNNTISIHGESLKEDMSHLYM